MANKLTKKCKRCGSTRKVPIETSTMHYAELRCEFCGRHEGYLSSNDEVKRIHAEDSMLAKHLRLTDLVHKQQQKHARKGNLTKDLFIDTGNAT